MKITYGDMCEENKKLYFVLDEDNPSVCYTQSEDRQEAAIDKAAAYFREQIVEDRQYGDYSVTCLLMISDDYGEKYETVEVKYSYHPDDDAYDHGRHDYLVAIGAR